MALAQEAVQSGRFSLKKVSTDRRERFDDETGRLAVLMSLGRGFARGREGRSLGANDRRGECGEENKESTIH